jgi:hypothetical protein
MAVRSIKSFELRWAKLRKLAAAQLKDFEKDRKALAKQIRQHKLRDDVTRAREAIAHSKRVEKAIKTTKKLVVAKNKVVRQAKRRGRLLKRALT